MRVEITVKTNAGKSEIQETNGKFYAFVKSHPEGGKANLELIKLAKKYFGKSVQIVLGKTSKKKVLEF